MDEYHTGSAEQVAAALAEYERMGVAHVMVHCAPYNATTLGRLAEALRVYRQLNRYVC